MEKFTGVVLLAAGSGERFGRPKAFVTLAGRTLVEHAATPFAGFPDRVLVLRDPAEEPHLLPGWKRARGGRRRRDSVEAGLDALDATTTRVLVHDAARPLVPRRVVERVVAALDDRVAAVPAVPVADTIKRVEAGRVVETPDRTRLVAVQTPQGFWVDTLRRALAASPADATDEAALVEALGEAVAVVEGDPRGLKITRPLDLEFAGVLVTRRDSNRAGLL